MKQQADAQTNLLALTESGMATLISPLGWPSFRTQQILRWLYQERVHAFDGMTNLSQKERAYLTAIAPSGEPRTSKSLPHRMEPESSY